MVSQPGSKVPNPKAGESKTQAEVTTIRQESRIWPKVSQVIHGKAKLVGQVNQELAEDHSAICSSHISA